MNKIFHGFEDVYPEKIAGTWEWFYGQVTPCSEAYEVKAYDGNYVGTRLYLFHIGGKVYEPFKQEKNVFLETPVYSSERNSFGLIRYDFNEKKIQAYEYFAERDELSLLTEIDMANADNLINFRIVKEPFMLAKHDMQGDAIDFLWPKEKHYQFEENESLCYVDGDEFITQKWVEDPNYREEIIYRQLTSGKIIERINGYIVEMPNGEKWVMTT